MSNDDNAWVKETSSVLGEDANEEHTSPFQVMMPYVVLQIMQRLESNHSVQVNATGHAGMYCANSTPCFIITDQKFLLPNEPSLLPSVVLLCSCNCSKGSVKESNVFLNYETEKITPKASDVAENLQLYRVVRFFRPRSSYMKHLMLFSERPPIYASCMTIVGGRTEEQVIIGFGELAAVD